MSARQALAVVVLNYRGADDTLACLDAVDRLDPAPGRVVVIDNGSGDGSVERLQQARPELDLRCNEGNLGYGAGQNAVLRELLEAGFDWIWLLNNDARPAPDALAAMLDVARGDSRIGAVGARLIDDVPTEHRRGPRLQALGGGRVHWWRGSAGEWRKPRLPADKLDYLTGASLLLRGAALRQVGLFDERFFLYWEDVDLCLRLRQAGWRLAVAERAEVRHRQSASTGADSPAKDRLINASAVRFFRKHGALGGWPAIVIGTIARVARRVLGMRLRHALAVLQGVRDGLR